MELIIHTLRALCPQLFIEKLPCIQDPARPSQSTTHYHGMHNRNEKSRLILEGTGEKEKTRCNQVLMWSIHQRCFRVWGKGVRE